MRKKNQNSNITYNENINRKSGIPTLGWSNKRSFYKQEHPKIQPSKVIKGHSKNSCSKTSPMRLKIVRSREGSPELTQNNSKPKVIGNVSIK